MSLLRSIAGGLRSLFRKAQVRQELDEELNGFLEMAADEKVKQGMSRKDALRAVRLERGSLEVTKEVVRDARWESYFETCWQDLRFALRMLRKSPGFTCIAVLTLAFGIGANTAVFTILNTVLLHPLPYPESGRMVNILRHDGGGDSIPMLVNVVQNNPCFDDLTGYDAAATGINLLGSDKPDVIRRLRVSQNYFRLFRARPILGRTFGADEDRPGGPRVVVLSYELWQQRFGGSPAAIGETITLGGGAYTIIGVLSPGYKLQPPADAWMPLQADPNSTDQAHIYMVSGRLRKGVTLAQANSEIAVVGKRYILMHPEQLGRDHSFQVSPLQEQLTGSVRPLLLILLGAVGLVLLIACANVANLLLARGTSRQKEIAVREALGAGRGRIARQLLTESLLVALSGGVLGLLLGSWGVRELLTLTPGDLPRVQEMTLIPALDPWVTGFAVSLSFVTAGLFGLYPALQLGRVDLAVSLCESSGRSGSGVRQNRTRSVLVAAEVTIAVVLLCGSILLIRSFSALHHVDPGFDPHNLLTMNVSLDGPAYEKAAVVNDMARQITERLERIPGVDSAALASSLPLESTMDMVFDIPGRPPLTDFKFSGDVLWIFTSPHYFQTMRIPLISGRLLQEQEPPRTLVINQAMAHRFWPNQNPVGQTILIGAQLGPAFEQGLTQIVGIVGDVHNKLEWESPPTMYQIHLQVSDAAMKLVNEHLPAGIMVRTKSGVAPMSVSNAVRQQLLASPIDLPTMNVETMDQLSLHSTARQNFSSLLLSLFAAIALLLTAVGIYGVMSYSIAQRTREIGIRAALGAARSDILKLVFRQASSVTLAGMAVGIAASLVLTRLLSSQLFGVTSSDPVTFVAVPLILLVVAVLAAWIPARRATRVDPIVALRYE